MKKKNSLIYMTNMIEPKAKEELEALALKMDRSRSWILREALKMYMKETVDK